MAIHAGILCGPDRRLMIGSAAEVGLTGVVPAAIVAT
jgi:hypothetical protein